ncbi:MAG: hypothetical protein ACFCVA_15085 [Gammaproteobacteria bacterium]
MAREELIIDLTGYGEEDVLDLKDWLEHNVSSISVKEKPSEPKEGTLGVEWLPILTAVLSAPTAVVLANAVRDWMRYRKKKLRIVISKPDGTHLTVESENIPPNELFSSD